MTAINFPNTPTVGELFTVNDIVWRWDGAFWTGVGNPVAGPAGANGTFIQASTSAPTSEQGNNGDLWIVYS